MAARARLELLNEDRAQLWVNLSFHSHPTQHGDDSSLCGLLLGPRTSWREYFGLNILENLRASERVESFRLCRHLNGNLSRRHFVDQEAHFWLETDAEAGHVRTVVRNIELVGGLGIGCGSGKGVVGFCGFNHLILFIKLFNYKY